MLRYYEHFGLQRDPFLDTADPNFYLALPGVRRNVRRVLTAIAQSRGLIVVVGPPGAGKTSLATSIEQSLLADENVVIGTILDPTFTNDVELLLAVGRVFGLTMKSRSSSVLQNALKSKLFFDAVVVEKRTLVLLIDEAQNLTDGNLETLRTLLSFQINKKNLLNLILFGQDELARSIEEHENFKDRVDAYVRLERLDSAASAALVEHRLARAGKPSSVVVFDPDALVRAIGAAGGLPRRLTTIARNAMIEAAQSGVQMVRIDHVVTALLNLGLSTRAGAGLAENVISGNVQDPHAARDRPLPPSARLVLVSDERYDRSADMRLLDLRREAIGAEPHVLPAKVYIDRDPLTGELSDTDNVPAPSGAILVARLDAQPRTTLRVGAMVTVSFTIANDGDAIAEDVRAGISLPADTVYRPGSFTIDGAPGDDDRADDLFARGSDCGDISPAACRTLVVELEIETGPADVILSPHVSTASGAIYGLRTLRLTRTAPALAPQSSPASLTVQPNAPIQRPVQYNAPVPVPVASIAAAAAMPAEVSAPVQAAAESSASVHAAAESSASVHAAAESSASVHAAAESSASVHAAAESSASIHAAAESSASVHAAAESSAPAHASGLAEVPSLPAEVPVEFSALTTSAEPEQLPVQFLTHAERLGSSNPQMPDDRVTQRPSVQPQQEVKPSPAVLQPMHRKSATQSPPARVKQSPPTRRKPVKQSPPASPPMQHEAGKQRAPARSKPTNRQQPSGPPVQHTAVIQPPTAYSNSVEQSTPPTPSSADHESVEQRAPAQPPTDHESVAQGAPARPPTEHKSVEQRAPAQLSIEHEHEHSRPAPRSQRKRVKLVKPVQSSHVPEPVLLAAPEPVLAAAPEPINEHITAPAGPSGSDTTMRAVGERRVRSVAKVVVPSMHGGARKPGRKLATQTSSKASKQDAMKPKPTLAPVPSEPIATPKPKREITKERPTQTPKPRTKTVASSVREGAKEPSRKHIAQTAPNVRLQDIVTSQRLTPAPAAPFKPMPAPAAPFKPTPAPAEPVLQQTPVPVLRPTPMPPEPAGKPVADATPAATTSTGIWIRASASPRPLVEPAHERPPLGVLAHQRPPLGGPAHQRPPVQDATREGTPVLAPAPERQAVPVITGDFRLEGKGGPILTVPIDRNRLASLARLFRGPSLGMIAHYLVLNALAATDALPGDGHDRSLAAFVKQQERFLTRALVSARLGKIPPTDMVAALLPVFPPAIAGRTTSATIGNSISSEVLLVRAFQTNEIVFLERMLSNVNAPPFLRAAQLFVGLCGNDVVAAQRDGGPVSAHLTAYAILATTEISRIFLRAKMTRTPELFKGTDPSFDDAARKVLHELETLIA